MSVHAEQCVRGGGGRRGGRELVPLRERERKSRAAQGRLLTEGAAWRSFGTSKQAATVTGKRGSIYYWEYYNYFCRAYSTGGRSCKVGAGLYFAFQVGKKKKQPQNVSASHVKMGKKREKMTTQLACQQTLGDSGSDTAERDIYE